jgi:hypothetical protein
MIKAGTGPRVLRLSPKRIGIRVGDHRRWLETREAHP